MRNDVRSLVRGSCKFVVTVIITACLFTNRFSRRFTVWVTERGLARLDVEATFRVRRYPEGRAAVIRVRTVLSKILISFLYISLNIMFFTVVVTRELKHAAFAKSGHSSETSPLAQSLSSAGSKICDEQVLQLFTPPELKFLKISLSSLQATCLSKSHAS